MNAATGPETSVIVTYTVLAGLGSAGPRSFRSRVVLIDGYTDETSIPRILAIKMGVDPANVQVDNIDRNGE